VTYSECISRREFIKQTTAVAAAAGPHVVSAAAAGSGGEPAPNDRIHLGIIGCGNMGRKNLSNCTQYDDVVVTAACDVWKQRLESVVKRHPDTCEAYRDYRVMLQEADVDAVIIATPPHWHALQAIHASEAGKDIFLQKPMTLHLGESLALRNAVQEHDVVSQIGTQIHARGNYRRVVEYVRSGNLGEIATVRTFMVMNQGKNGIGTVEERKTPEELGWDLDWDMWCGPAPKMPFHSLVIQDAGHRPSWMDYSGGWTPGMAPHIIDLPIWALELDYPTQVSSSGGRLVVQDDGDAYDNHEALWRYPDRTMTWMMSLTNSYGFDFHNRPQPRRRLGIYFHGVNGTLYSNYGRHDVVPEGDRLENKKRPPKSIPSSPGHEREWLNCVKSREEPSCHVPYHVKVDVPIVLSLLSYRLDRSIDFDPGEEWVTGDEEASREAVPDYRDPWEFPDKYLET